MHTARDAGRLLSSFAILATSLLTAEPPHSSARVQDLEGAPRSAWQSDQGDGTFRNPILYADYCDPDIIRVGEDFYMVSTTFVNAPGINLLHSKDLVNWELAAHIASTVDGGDRFDMKGGTAYQGGYWAPSIRHHNGTFYVAVQPTFAAGRIYYATQPTGPWKCHQLDRGIYDPGLFIDTDGTGYLVCGHSPQSLMKLSPDFSKIVEEKKDFLPSGAEGSHVIKRGRYYYVFNAKPTVWPFQLLCSRTTSLTNPSWETRVALTAITGGHQGAIVDIDDKDHWFGFVHHDSGGIGRMPQIGPVFWENDWPIFGTPENPNVLAERYPKPINGKPLTQPATSDDFSSTTLGLQWAWNHNPDDSRWSLTERPGFLRLHPTYAQGFWTARNTLTQKAQGPTCQGVVKLDLAGMKPGDVAGFGTLGKVMGQLFVTADAQGRKTLGMRMVKDKVGSYIGAADIPLSGNTLYLRTDLDFVRNLGVCSYSTTGSDWTTVGGNFELMFGYGTTFQGEQFALFCYNPQTDASAGWVDVDSFTFTGLDEKSDLVQTQRGRPYLNAQRTTFVADNGQLLRGPYESTEWTKAAPYEEVKRMKDLGFNAVHLYAECFDAKYPAAGSNRPGYAMKEVDKFVDMTRDLGLYLVITIGNGANNGKYNTQWITDFWKLYGARYAKETHVLYEVQNEPVAWGPPYSSPKATPPGAVDMEIAAYKTIREVAPESPILLFSYSVLWDGAGKEALKDLAAFNNGVGGDRGTIWSNAAIAFHGYAGHTRVPAALDDLLKAGYPCFMTEFIGRSWGGTDGQDIELTADLERLGLSWTNFLTIPPEGVSPYVTIPEVFKNRIERSGIAWTPDFGVWPVQRGVFGNQGQARTTTSTWDKDMLKGTFHLEMEDFDTGGPGVAYGGFWRDPNPKNTYRPDERVDIRAISDASSGYAVSVKRTPAWLDYTIYTKEPGAYELALRYASEQQGSTVRVLLGGKEILAATPLETTQSLSAWRTLKKPVFLEYGRNVLRVEIPRGGCDLNWLEITPDTHGPVPDGIYKILNRNSGLAMTNNVAKDADKKQIAANEAANDQAGGNEFAKKVGTNIVIQAPFSGQNTQLWRLQHLGAGQYRISSMENKWFWSTGGSERPISMVWWGGEKTGPQQRYVIRPEADGYFRIAPVEGGLDIDVTHASTAINATVGIGDGRYKAEAHQLWAVLPAAAIEIPESVAAERTGASQVTVTWKAVPGATDYVVKRAEKRGGPYTSFRIEGNQTAYVDSDVAQGKDYFYVVVAIGQGGEGLNSAEVCPGKLHAQLRFDESSGNVAKDAIGNRWNGTLTGHPQRVRGRVGNALALDGKDDCVTLSEGVVSELTDMSICAWVDIEAASPSARIFDFAVKGKPAYLWLTPSDGPNHTLRFAINAGSGEQAIWSRRPVPTGKWVHVAVVLKDGVGTLYLNGEPVGRNASITLTPKAVGKTTVNVIARLQGKVEDFRIYANAISPGEVAAQARMVPTAADSGR